MYNCKHCQEVKEIDKRQCFWFGDEVQEICAEQNVDNMYGNRIITKGEKYNVSSDELISIITEIVNTYDKFSCLAACRTVFPQVCPKSLITNGIDQLLSMEAFCRDYHVPPLGASVGYLDYPQILVEIFGTISVARERVRARELAEIKAGIQ